MSNKVTPKPFVFVLMPFSNDFNDIYELGIKAVCDQVGAYCERIDEQYFIGSISERLYNQIAKADIIVAEMTGKNANVFYETGYAHALGKNVILLTQKTKDIPFDLANYPHIIYESQIIKLKTELEKRILWHIQNPAEPLSSSKIDLRFYMLGICLNETPNVSYSIGKYNLTHHLNMKLIVQNPTNKTYDPTSLRLGIITSSEFTSSENTEKYARLPDGKYIHFLRKFDWIFPESWDSVSFKLLSGREEIKISSTYNFELNLYTKMGKQTFPILFKITNMNTK